MRKFYKTKVNKGELKAKINIKEFYKAKVKIYEANVSLH